MANAAAEVCGTYRDEVIGLGTGGNVLRTASGEAAEFDVVELFMSCRVHWNF